MCFQIQCSLYHPCWCIHLLPAIFGDNQNYFKKRMWMMHDFLEDSKSYKILSNYLMKSMNHRILFPIIELSRYKTLLCQWVLRLLENLFKLIKSFLQWYSNLSITYSYQQIPLRKLKLHPLYDYITLFLIFMSINLALYYSHYTHNSN